MLRVLASLGTQMAAFIHEIKGLLGLVLSIDQAFMRLRNDSSYPKDVRTSLANLHSVIGDLRRTLEKHASYLLDIVTPDARRRRIRQSFAERFDAGVRLVQHIAEKKEIEIINKIPPELKSPPMFPAELTTVFSNLLTNAVKAASKHGRIKATGRHVQDERVQILIENTGASVDPRKGERWFKPFESTTTAIDPVLGQGMGLGLPITRSLLEEYGGDIRFVEPSQGFAAAISITFVLD